MLLFLENPNDNRQRVEVERLPSADFALAKLADVGEVVGAVERGDMSSQEALHSLDEIERAPSPWGRSAVAISYAAIGSGIAVLLGGTWLDVALGAPMALIVYGLALALSRFGARWAAFVPLLTAFVPAVVASTVRHWQPEVNVLVVTIAAIAVLLPGYAVSVGVGELVEGYVVAGWENLGRGLVYLAKQVLGAWLGVAVVHSIADPPLAPAEAPVAEGWLWLFMPLLIVGLCVVFQTARRDFPWAAISCALAFVTSLLGDLWNENLGTLVAAAAAAIYANVWASRSGRPTSIVLLPAVIVLVSGSIGFRGLMALAEGDTTFGAQQFVQMFVVAVMLTAGLLIGNTIVRPRTTL
jgi:uncharacterized membrane protein YjjP (DUF1212 family)